MSEAIAFDTHRFIKHLTKNGFTEQQAEALANEQVNLLNGNLATKIDIALIHKEIAAIHRDIAAIHKEIETLRLDTKAEIAVIHKDIEGIRKEIAAIHKDIEGIRKEIEDGREDSQNQQKATEAAFANQWKATEAALNNQWKATEAAFEIQRKTTEAAIEALKVELLKWMFGAMIAQGGMIVGLIVALISDTP